MNPTPKHWGSKNAGWGRLAGIPSTEVPGGSILCVTSRWCWAETHLEDIVEPGEGWLLSEALFPGELWSLSPWLLQWLASSSNSCPDMILSISSSDIFDKELIHVRLGIQDSFGYFKTENLFQLHGDSQTFSRNTQIPFPLSPYSRLITNLGWLASHHHGSPEPSSCLFNLSQAIKPLGSSSLLFVLKSILSYFWIAPLP